MIQPRKTHWGEWHTLTWEKKWKITQIFYDALDGDSLVEIMEKRRVCHPEAVRSVGCYLIARRYLPRIYTMKDMKEALEEARKYEI